MGTEKIDLGKVAVGYEFSPSSYVIDANCVTSYLKAVDDEYDFPRGQTTVPPLAILALAMVSFSEGVQLTPGTIHVSQEIEFKKPVSLGEILTSYSRVVRNQSRGKMHLVNVEIEIKNTGQVTVASGKIGFILPEPGN